MNRTKYEGKLTDSLIQIVIDAEKRVVPQPETDRTPQIDRQVGTNSPVEQFSGWSDQSAAYRRRLSPTHAEQRDAWVRRNGPDESDEEEE